jgi:hypothetical protein
MPFKPGQSGNPSGRPKTNLNSILSAELQKKFEGNKKLTNEAMIVKTLLKLAIEDENLEALKYVYDRMEGRMKDNVEIGAVDGMPVNFTLKLGDKGSM